MCVCIATAVDFSIQVQMNQWKIVWLPVWMNLMLLLEVVLSLVRVPCIKLQLSYHETRNILSLVSTFLFATSDKINECVNDNVFIFVSYCLQHIKFIRIIWWWKIESDCFPSSNDHNDVCTISLIISFPLQKYNMWVLSCSWAERLQFQSKLKYWR